MNENQLNPVAQAPIMAELERVERMVAELYSKLESTVITPAPRADSSTGGGTTLSSRLHLIVEVLDHILTNIEL